MRKILVSAYACEPLKGSEQSVGWNMVLQISKHSEVHVITRTNNKEFIESNLPSNNKKNIFFHYYDTNFFIRKFKKKEKGVYFYYICWQIGIIPLVRRLTKLYYFDYSMHLTFGNVWLPTFLPFFYPAFIWGPLGGGESVPYSFIRSLSLKGKVLQLIRYALKVIMLLNPFFLYISLSAKIILCRTENTSRLFLRKLRNKIYLLSDGAIEPQVFKYKMSFHENGVINIITTSRLIHTKNIITVIRSVLYIPSSYKIKLTIVGSGPEKNNLEIAINRYGIKDRVNMIPTVSREEVLQMLAKSDIYLFASLKEACNLSLLEAMAVGLPVICLNWSGMAISTDESCAIRLPVTNPEQMPKDMAVAICKLIDNPEMRRQMGNAGRKRVKAIFNWETKGIFVDNLFAELEKK
jgi:glycosyltransferase involved in cell wall biosynthesis